MINHLSFDQRLEIGKGREEGIKSCLRDHGYPVDDVDDFTDIHKKLDCYFGEHRELSQIKTRDDGSGRDVLIDVFEPFYGLYDSRTKPARDTRSEYIYYIVLSRGILYVIRGDSQKHIIKRVLTEWKDKQCRLPFDSRLYEDVNGNSVQLKRTRDAASGTPKLLMFIPITVYAAGDIIATIDYTKHTLNKCA